MKKKQYATYFYQLAILVPQVNHIASFTKNNSIATNERGFLSKCFCYIHKRFWFLGWQVHQCRRRYNSWDSSIPAQSGIIKGMGLVLKAGLPSTPLATIASSPIQHYHVSWQAQEPYSSLGSQATGYPLSIMKESIITVYRTVNLVHV